jgi:hypothetical protein
MSRIDLTQWIIQRGISMSPQPVAAGLAAERTIVQGYRMPCYSASWL